MDKTEPDENFYTRANKALCNISDCLEQQAVGFLDLEVEPERLTLQTDQGVCLINIHETAQQIWVSSPFTGAHHFAYKPSWGGWRSTKDHTITLEDCLSQEYSRLLECTIRVRL